MWIYGRRDKRSDWETGISKVIPFGENWEALLRTYLDEKSSLGVWKMGAMFVDEREERLTNVKVRNLVRHYLGMVTTQKKGVRVLRHTFATSMLNHHADLESLKGLLGHESISTTEIYTHTTFEELKEMYNQAHPRA